MFDKPLNIQKHNKLLFEDKNRILIKLILIFVFAFIYFLQKKNIENEHWLYKTTTKFKISKVSLRYKEVETEIFWRKLENPRYIGSV